MSTRLTNKALTLILVAVVGFTLGTAARAWWDDSWDSITIIGNR